MSHQPIQFTDNSLMSLAKLEIEPCLKREGQIRSLALFSLLQAQSSEGKMVHRPLEFSDTNGGDVVVEENVMLG